MIEAVFTVGEDSTLVSRSVGNVDGNRDWSDNKSVGESSASDGIDKGSNAEVTSIFDAYSLGSGV